MNQPPNKPPFSVKSCMRPGEQVNPMTLGRVASGPESQCKRVARGMLAVLAQAVKERRSGNKS